MADRQRFMVAEVVVRESIHQAVAERIQQIVLLFCGTQVPSLLSLLSQA
jgi:hypothetical protein